MSGAREADRSASACGSSRLCRRPASRPRSATGSSATTRSTRSCAARASTSRSSTTTSPSASSPPTLRDTYAALGVVHQSWRPIPGRFKDYIAMPKPNLYQSLHTTVLGERGQPFEVQIRTREMDLVAEEGIAAHWRYKEGKRGRRRRDRDPNIVWLRQLLEWQKEVKDPRTFLTTLKIDLYPDEVYVFTPKGEVLLVPARRHAARLRLPRPHRPRPPLRRRAGQRQAGAAAHRAAERRHRRDPHQPDAPAQPRLARPRRHLARQEQDPPLAQHPAEGSGAIEIGRRLLEKELRRYKVQPARRRSRAREMRSLPGRGRARRGSTTSTAGSASARSACARCSTRVLGEEQLARRRRSPGRLRQAVDRLLPSGGAGPIAVKGQGDLLASWPSAAARCPARRSSATSPAAAASRCTRSTARTSATCSTTPSARSRSSGRASDRGVYPVTLRIETEDQPGMLARLTEAIAKRETNIRQIEARDGWSPAAG